MRGKKPFIGVLATAALAVGAVVVGVPTAGGQTGAACPVSSADQAVDAEEQQLLVLINQYRQANGKNALTMHTGVTRASAWFSRDLADKNYFPPNHVDSNGRAPNTRLTWCGVSYTNWAENIYAGTPGAQSVFNAWRASSGHNANMLRDGITAAGIARAYNPASTYGWYWTLNLTNSAATSPTTTVAPSPTTTRAPVVTTTVAPSPTTTRAPVATTTTTVAPTPTPTTLPWWYYYYRR